MALTRTLKTAAREIGLRGRCIRLSPQDIRKLVLRGSRSDPGYAVTGAPPALIDAISDMFMIPYENTKTIAAKFIAGHVTESAHLLLKQLRTETIRRLDIERALIGTSLLEPVARQLLGGNRSRHGSRQPFGDQGIAFFGMTTDLIAQSSICLGGEDLFPGAPYDYVEAALASSAFPVVFAPRQESSIFPGIGSAEILFADGGMFDNLPFFPAIDLLSWGQRQYRMSAEGQQKSAHKFLGERLESPDLFLCGALNAVPERPEEATREFDTINAINNRASTLQDNVKIRAFEYSSMRVNDQLKRFYKANPDSASTAAHHHVDDVVSAAVLPIFPSSAQHLNGTFAFCRSMNLDPERVCTSIADGCFQTLSTLAREQKKAQCPPEELDKNRMLAAKSVSAFVKQGRIPALQRRKR